MKTPPNTPCAAVAVEPGAGVVVWGTWLVSVLLVVGLIAWYACPIPRWDDYDSLPVALGAQPITAAWLVSPHNEHRVVLPRLVMLALSSLFGPDARAAMLLSVVALATAGAWLIRQLARRPGGLRVADALFPILLLSLGQHGNWLWATQIQFTMPTALVVVLLSQAIPMGQGPMSTRQALFVGVCLVLLSACGANGLAFVPAGVSWLLIEAVRAGWRKGIGFVLAALPGLVITALALWFAPRSIAPGGAPALADVGRSLVQFAAIGLGTAAAPGWIPLGALVLLLDVLAMVGLVLTALRKPEQRSSALGLACLLLGGLLLASGVAWGRTGAGPRAGLEDRYVTIALPLVLTPVLAMRLLLGEATARALLSSALIGTCVLFWPNAEAARAEGRRHAETYAAINRDLASGLTNSQLLRRFVPYLSPSQDAIAPMLPLLRRSGIGRLAQLRPDPSYRALPLDPRANSLHLARVEGDSYVTTGVDPWLEYRLASPLYVAGVRLRYDHENSHGEPARFVLTWRRFDQPSPPAEQRIANWTLATGNDREVTFWIHDQVNVIAIQPDNGPCRFRVRSVELLAP